MNVDIMIYHCRIAYLVSGSL